MQTIISKKTLLLQRGPRPFQFIALHMGRVRSSYFETRCTHSEFHCPDFQEKEKAVPILRGMLYFTCVCFALFAHRGDPPPPQMVVLCFVFVFYVFVVRFLFLFRVPAKVKLQLLKYMGTRSYAFPPSLNYNCTPSKWQTHITEDREPFR